MEESVKVTASSRAMFGSWIIQNDPISTCTTETIHEDSTSTFYILKKYKNGHSAGYGHHQWYYEYETWTPKALYWRRRYVLR